MNYKFLLVSILLLIMLGSVHAGLTDDLISYWKFDETSGTTLIDSLNNNNGTNDGATINQTGIINKAYNFDGSNDKVTMANEANFDFLTSLNPTFTISIWFKSSKNDSQIIWNKFDQSAQRGTKLDVRANGVFYFTHYYSTGAGENWYSYSGNTNALNGNWHNVIAVASGNESWKLYLDGNELSMTKVGSGPATQINITNPFLIGLNSEGSTQFEGTLDELGVWSRALTSNEITELYNSGNGLTYPFQGISVDFNYIIRKDLNKIILTDTSVANKVTKTAWTWTNNSSTISTAQDYNLTATELTDYNICLHVDTNVSDVNGDKCYQFNTGDWTPPVTTFSSFQVEGTTDQNITLTCTDNNTGCKTINYNINGTGWTTKNRFDQNVNVYDFNAGPFASNPSIAVETDQNVFFWYASTDYNTLISTIKYTQGQGGNGAVNSYMQILYYDGTIHTFSTHYVNDTTTTFTETNPNPTKRVFGVIGHSWHSGSGTNTSSIYDINIFINETPLSINPISFLYSGAGSHSIQYFSTDNSDNNETTKTSNFTTYGNARFRIKDQNSGLDLNGTQINFNGSDYVSGSNVYDFNLQELTATNTPYLFTISKTGYSTRYYQIDLNYFSEFDTNFALLPDSLDSDVPFKVYETDETTIFSNTYVEVKDSDTNWTVGRLKTNTTGNVTFNLKENDQNYNAIVNNGQYIYTPVALTILYPKNEDTQEQITENWKVQITQNLYALYTDLNTSKIVYLLPNTALPFQIKVSDMNGNYYPRTYSKTYPGNPLTDTLQPYLISTTDAYPTSIYVKDATTNNPIQNVTLAIYLQVESGYTLIEQVTTDASGSAKVSLIQLTDYYFDVYDDDTTWYTKERKQAINNEIYFYLVQEETDWNYNEPVSVFNYFSPGYYTLSTISYDRIIRIKTTCNQTTTDDYNLNIFQQGNIIYNYHTVVNQCDETNVFTIGTDFNIPDYNYPIKLVLKVIYNDDSNTGTWTQEYMVASPYKGFDVFKTLRFDLKQEMGCSTSNNPLIPCVPLLIFFVIFLIVSAAGVSKVVGFSVKKIGMLVIFELLFFTGIGFVPIGLAVILGAITFLAAFVASTGGEF